MKLTVVHLEGSKQGQTEYAPGPVVSIGRDPANNIAFDAFKDLDVSTRHATITFQGQQVMLQDLGSRNGTFLNGAKVAGAVPLPNDSVVQFGDKGPKVKLSYVFAVGPGKKTQMIQDLSSKLEGAEKDQQAASKRNKTLGCCFVFLLVFGGLGYGIFSWWSKKKAAREAVVVLKEDVPRERAKAESKGAATSAEAKADWDAALAALADGEAKAEDDPAAAQAAYELARARFATAGETAMMAEFTRMKGVMASGDKGAKDRADAAAALQAQIQAAVDKAKKEQDERLAALQRELAAASLDKLKGQIDRLAASTNPDELKQGVAALQSALAANPDDQALKDQLAAFKDKVARIENVGDLLNQVAKDAKEKVVGLRTRIFAIPGNQTVQTTNIHVAVAEGFGTGFWVSADGLLVTAKEVVEPHLFNAQSAALARKLTDKGYKLLADLEVMTTTAGIYTSTYTAAAVPSTGAAVGTGAKIAVSRRFNDSIGAPQPVKITFDNAEVEVSVQLHRRDESDLVILKVDGVTAAKFFPVASAEPAVGTVLAALGVQTGGADLGLEPGQVGLFMFQGKVETTGRKLDLGMPSYPSWVGGPIVNSDGKVLGILLEQSTERSKGLAATVFVNEIK